MEVYGITGMTFDEDGNVEHSTYDKPNAIKLIKTCLGLLDDSSPRPDLIEDWTRAYAEWVRNG
jgi:hypothetical protein